MTRKPLAAASVVGLVSLIVGVVIGRFSSPGGREAAMDRYGLPSREEFEELRARHEQALRELKRLEVAKDRATRNWRKLLLASRRKDAGATPGGDDVALTGATPDGGEQETATFDLETLKALLREGRTAEGLITADGIEKTLEKNGRSPDLLVAAARLSSDVETALGYLEEALEKDPDSPGALQALLATLIASGEVGEFPLALAEELKALDPTNSLANYYAAHLKLEQGDLDGALAEIGAGASRTFLNDYGLKRLPALESFYRDAGCSEGVASVLAIAGVKLEYLPMLRALAGVTLDRSGQSHSGGDFETALSLARSGAQIGNRLSSAGRYLIQDLVGIAIENQSLEAERRIQEALGNRGEVERIEKRLQNNATRVARTSTISKVFIDALLSMSEQEMARYFDRITREGEAAVAQELPLVRKALQEQAGADDR